MARTPGIRAGGPFKAQQGGALPLVLMVGLMGAVLGVSLLSLSFEGYRQARQHVDDQQSYYAAMAGVEVALADIRLAPDQFLKAGMTWASPAGASASLRYTVSLRAGETAGTYMLVSSSTSALGPAGPAGMEVTLAAEQDGTDALSHYAVAIGGDFIIRRANDSVRLWGGPVLVSGNLQVPLDPHDALYPLSDGRPVAVGGSAMLLQTGKELAATAGELGAADLTAGVPPVDVGAAIAAAIDQASQAGAANVMAYNPDGWELYQQPLQRMVYVDGDLDLTRKKDPLVFWGRLVVRGNVTLASGSSLVVYGALDAGGVTFGSGSDVTSLQVYYTPDMIPATEAGTVQVVDWQVNR